MTMRDTIGRREFLKASAAFAGAAAAEDAARRLFARSGMARGCGACLCLRPFEALAFDVCDTLVMSFSPCFATQAYLVVETLSRSRGSAPLPGYDRSSEMPGLRAKRAGLRRYMLDAGKCACHPIGKP